MQKKMNLKNRHCEEAAGRRGNLLTFALREPFIFLGGIERPSKLQRQGKVGKMNKPNKMGEPEGMALPLVYVALSFFDLTLRYRALVTIKLLRKARKQGAIGSG